MRKLHQSEVSGKARVRMQTRPLIIIQEANALVMQVPFSLPPSLPPTRFYELYRSRFIVEARKEEKELRCMIYVHFKGPREVTLDVL